MNGGMERPALGRELYSRERIEAAVRRLAAEIAVAYRGQPLIVLGVLKGALYFTVDLARALAEIAGGPSEIFVDYLCVVSYEGTESTANVRLLLEEATPLTGRHVLIVEDIADNGLTLAYLQALLLERRPASLRTCTLFDKPSRRKVKIPLDYVGLSVPNTFAVGYGLDYQERYRNLPYLAELEIQESQRELT
ncbi:MAG TPA: hypoxanthine phosphoribosyltransferase [Candidatus Baltobacteraceae bacterium]|jgi:hypoxanthine phosphoribosyltransferase|nr:hypoxanthine phosphoribosyltransferase [Candidatus Baltobacteraceae bacterium]